MRSLCQNSRNCEEKRSRNIRDHRRQRDHKGPTAKLGQLAGNSAAAAGTQTYRYRQSKSTARAPRSGNFIYIIERMSSVAVGTAEPGPGPGPDRKRRRLLDAGGPVEDDETARQKMRDAKVYARGVDGTYGDWVGFDPDNVRDVKSLFPNNTSYDITAMGYFARDDDLPMMRWLYVNGADTRDVDVDINFPMLKAAGNGHIEVCKWLYDHGAAKDVKRGADGRSLLTVTFGRSRATPSCGNLSRWLILNGALCKDDDSGELDEERMENDLDPERYPNHYHQERKTLLEWANDLHRARTSSLLFLSGVISRPKHAHNTHRNVSPLQLLGGKTGVLELIGDYVGFVRGREAKITRQLTEMLPRVDRRLVRRAEEAMEAEHRAFLRDLQRGEQCLLRLAEEAERRTE